MQLDLIAIIAIVSLSVMLVSTLTGYLNLKSRFKNIEEEGEAIKAQARQHAKAVLDQAQETALKLAQEAIVNASQRKTEIAQKLDDVSQVQIEEYKRLIEQSSQQTISEMSRMMSSKMDEEWTKLKEEIGQYKQIRQQEIDRRVAEAVRHATEQLIGKAITPDLHEELVMKTLVQAKSEYGF
jgi:F0F1-type ATP synthase membrane subunit b/b'